jgi:hypothetical protein
MDELTLMRQFRAEGAGPDPKARADAWRVLEARIGAEAAATPIHRGFLRRRRVLSFAAATAFAAVLAGVVVLSSGPTAQPAAAEVLRETAAVARQSGGPSGVPGPGQFFYLKQEERSLEEWGSKYTASYGGIRPKEKDAVGAFVTTLQESWRSAQGMSRNRWRLEPLDFFTDADRAKWEAEGKPLPASFNDEAPTAGLEDAHVNEVRRGLFDVEAREDGHFLDSSIYPTDPKALREGIEGHSIPGAPEYDQVEGPLNVPETIAELWDILEKPNVTAPLRAAVYGALAELPGIELKEGAKDLVGRTGDAIVIEGHGEDESLAAENGMRIEFIFDPETSALLGERETLVDPTLRPWAQGIPAGTVTRELAYLDSGMVDSTHSRPGEGEPKATTTPTYK